MRTIPHLLTVSRLLAAPWIVWALIHAEFRLALVVVLVAGLTDWFDGFAARRLSVSGKIGVILDPLADKILLVTLFVALGVIGLLPVWLVALTIGRDVVIVTGAALLRLFRNIRRFLPSPLGKVSTFFQIVLVFMVLIEAAYPNSLFLVLRNTALVLSAIFTSLSGLDYVRRGIDGARVGE